MDHIDKLNPLNASVKKGKFHQKPGPPFSWIISHVKEYIFVNIIIAFQGFASNLS